jgi:hypothetical protein
MDVNYREFANFTESLHIFTLIVFEAIQDYITLLLNIKTGYSNL